MSFRTLKRLACAYQLEGTQDADNARRLMPGPSTDLLFGTRLRHSTAQMAAL